jgi:leucyl-tRNA synthetase
MTHYAHIHGFGEAATTYRLRDWGISRQRFWGAPIPIIYCEKCGVLPVPYEQLPVELPENAEITGTGESPLARVEEFVNTNCPNCGGAATRETDTMDTFVDSSWYFYRYVDPRNADQPIENQLAAYWAPVDQYIGGIDHAVMHLLYARFWTKVMRDIGIVDFSEPFKSLLNQGMVVGETFFDDSSGKPVYYPKESVKTERDAKGKVTSAVLKENGTSLKFAVERMSKSKGNGVNPDEMVNIYGADAARIYVLFSAPAENELVWNDSGIEGAVRFIQRVYRFVWRWHEALKNAPQSEPGEMLPEARKLRQKTHQTIKRVEDDFDRLQLNTPVAALMELSNALGEIKIEPAEANESILFAVNEALRSLVLMLASYAPHAAEEMWAALTGSEEGILKSGAKFPEFNAELARKDEIEIPIQINGKLRSRVMAAPDTSKEELEAMALADEKAREYMKGKQIVKIVVVPSRLVNIVVK